MAIRTLGVGVVVSRRRRGSDSDLRFIVFSGRRTLRMTRTSPHHNSPVINNSHPRNSFYEGGVTSYRQHRGECPQGRPQKPIPTWGCYLGHLRHCRCTRLDHMPPMQPSHGLFSGWRRASLEEMVVVVVVVVGQGEGHPRFRSRGCNGSSLLEVRMVKSEGIL